MWFDLFFLFQYFLLIFFFLFVLRLCSELNRDHAFLLFIYSLIYVTLDLVVPSKIATLYDVPSISGYNWYHGDRVFKNGCYYGGWYLKKTTIHNPILFHFLYIIKKILNFNFKKNIKITLLPFFRVILSFKYNI